MRAGKWEGGGVLARKGVHIYPICKPRHLDLTQGAGQAEDGEEKEDEEAEDRVKSSDQRAAAAIASVPPAASTCVKIIQK